MRALRSVGKVLVLCLWAVCAFSVLYPDGSARSEALRWCFWALVVAHGAECAILYRYTQKLGATRARDLGLTFLFGVFHLLPRIGELRESAASHAGEES